jgi:DNA modification methylase
LTDVKVVARARGRCPTCKKPASIIRFGEPTAPPESWMEMPVHDATGLGWCNVSMTKSIDTPLLDERAIEPAEPWEVTEGTASRKAPKQRRKHAARKDEPRELPPRGDERVRAYGEEGSSDEPVARHDGKARLSSLKGCDGRSAEGVSHSAGVLLSIPLVGTDGSLSGLPASSSTPEARPAGMPLHGAAPFVILEGDVRARLRELPDESVHCVVTSIPYWGLRFYATTPQVWGGDAQHEHIWSAGPTITKRGSRGGESTIDGKASRNVVAQAATAQYVAGSFCACGAWLGELGLEPTPELYVAHVVEVFREVYRVLRKDGTLWLNVGDTYVTGAGRVGEKPGSAYGKHAANGVTGSMPETQPNRMPIAGLPAKNLALIPQRLALALQQDGWIVRGDDIWFKQFGMPESATDRPSTKHEHILMLVKEPRYFFDMEAVREAPSPNTKRDKRNPKDAPRKERDQNGPANRGGHEGRNLGSVWTFRQNTARWGYCEPCDFYVEGAAYLGLEIVKERTPDGMEIVRRLCPHCRTWTGWAEHFATFPVALPERCILASTSAKGACADCGAPWRRITEKSHHGRDGRDRGGVGAQHRRESIGRTEVRRRPFQEGVVYHTRGWQPTCDCDADVVPCVVLDPFSGSGSTGVAALGQGRHYVGVELNGRYARLSQRRIPAQASVEAAALAKRAARARQEQARLAVGGSDP